MMLKTCLDLTSSIFLLETITLKDKKAFSFQGDRRGVRRRHHSTGRAEGHDHGRYALRPVAAGRARDDDLLMHSREL